MGECVFGTRDIAWHQESTVYVPLQWWCLASCGNYLSTNQRLYLYSFPTKYCMKKSKKKKKIKCKKYKCVYAPLAVHTCVLQIARGFAKASSFITRKVIDLITTKKECLSCFRWLSTRAFTLIRFDSIFAHRCYAVSIVPTDDMVSRSVFFFLIVTIDFN